MADINEVATIVARAKAVYMNKLAACDGLLQAVVSQDPSRLTAAQAVQTDYTVGITPVSLAELIQPT